MKINFVQRILVGAIEGPNGARFRKDLPPGSAMWCRGLDGKIACLHFTCPCGCGEFGSVPVAPGYGGHMWNWNGNETEPTLTPSIQKLGACRWHGYLTDGEFKTC